MQQQIKSKYILAGLISVMVVIKIFDIIFDPNKIFSGRIAVFSWNEIIIVSILGILGLFFYKKINLPKFDNKKIRNKKNILISILLGLFFAFLLSFLDYFAVIGDMSVGFPLAILFYIWGAISSEIIFRLFAISLIVWFFSYIIFKGKHKKNIYISVSVILSLLTSFSMLAAFSNPEIHLNKPEGVLFFLLGFLVFLSEMSAFMLLKRYGFLSCIIFRLSFYSIWHIIWPILFY